MKHTSTTSNRTAARRRPPATARPRPSGGTNPKRARERLAARVMIALPDGLSPEEVQAHFNGMPERYWTGLDEADLHWHLRAVHGFFEKLAHVSSSGTPVWVDWVDSPMGEHSRVVVCSWDRRGLLEQIAAAFGALRFSIRQADVYTRSDSLALDVFQVCPPEGGAVGDTDRAEKLAFLVEGAYTHPPRFASVWSTKVHKVLPRHRGLPPQVRFDNRSSRSHTVLWVRASDRMGLLYDLLHALRGHRLEIAQAIIQTRRGRAEDQFHIADAEGNKITEAGSLIQLRDDLKDAIES